MSRLSCEKIIKEKLGDEYLELCNVNDDKIEIERKPVIGWLITYSDEVVSAYPIIYSKYTKGRETYNDIVIGYSVDRDEPNTIILHDEIDALEKIAGVIPSWKDTYYVYGYVNDIAFTLGVFPFDVSDNVLKLVLRNMYFKWLSEANAEEIKRVYERRGKE